MCGRYTLTEDAEAIAEAFEADIGPLATVHEPRYNIAPTQDAPVVISADGGRRCGLMRWGLVPHWADSPAVGSRMINARVESVRTRPAFKDAFQRKRCLVPADGFYEWEDRASGKQPYWIHRRDADLLAFAGLWATWMAPDDVRVHTFCILTRAAPSSISWLHDRAPVILPPDAWTDWLAKGQAPESLEALLNGAKAPMLMAHPVSRRVNKADYDEPDCTDEVDLDDDPVPEQTSFF